jgi:hypothetical protein
MGKHRWKGELAKPIRPKVIRPRGLRATKKTAQVANEEMEDLYLRAIEEEYLRAVAQNTKKSIGRGKTLLKVEALIPELKSICLRD